MRRMTEVKTAELDGAALDWAVASMLNGQSIFFEVFGARMLGRLIMEEVISGSIKPSTDWSQGGPLIEKYEITLWPPRHLVRKEENWGAQYYVVNDPKILRGNSPLIAACRAIVDAKLGDTVSVPAELVP